MDGEYRKLMDNFRLSIRRKKIDQLFQTQRAQLLKHQTENQKQQLKYLLQNTQSRQNWLHDTALKLTGFPNIQWASLLNNLYYALPLFEDHYEEWEKLGIIKAICDSLAPEYLQLNLTRVVANILTDIFYMSLKSQNQRLAKSILEYKFIDRIMQIMMLSPSNQYIRLVGIFCEVAPNMRNYLISQQLLSFILKRVKQLHENENKINQSFHSILYLVYSLLKSHQFDLKTFSRPKKTTISALLPLLCSELQSNHTAQNFCLILKSLKQICVIGKEQVFQQLIRYPTIFDKALQLFCFENRHEIRYQSAKFICNFLLSSNPEHTKILANKNILHRVYESYRLVDNRDENRLMLLSLLSNFTADYRQFQQMFVMHPLLQEIVIPEAGYSHNDNLRRQAVYCICNILRAGEQDELCFKIMTQLNITDILVLNLNRLQPDVETVKQILSTWRQVMANSSQTSKESLTYRIVKNSYDIGGILENLSDIDDLESHVLEFSCFFTQLQMD